MRHPGRVTCDKCGHDIAPDLQARQLLAKGGGPVVATPVRFE